MMTKDEFEHLLNWPEDKQSPVLSVYLTAGSTGGEAFRRTFETTFAKLLGKFKAAGSAEQLEELRKDGDRMRLFLASFTPESRSAVLFSDDSRSFAWGKELHVKVRNRASWLTKPYILPLVESLDEYERCCVILADKSKARIFTFRLGEVEEEKGALAWNGVKRFRTTGKDNLRSAVKLQRTAEMHEAWHLKHVAAIAAQLAARKPFGRLIIGGAEKSAEKLAACLPKSLKEKISARISLPVRTDEKTLIKTLLGLECKIEREGEVRLVERFVQREPAAARRKAFGFDAALLNLGKGLVRKLIYSERFHPQGGRCLGCGHLFPGVRRLMCGRCGFAIERVPEMLEEMARLTLQKGGEIEEVRGAAADELDKAGGVGAILRERALR